MNAERREGRRPPMHTWLTRIHETVSEIESLWSAAGCKSPGQQLFVDVLVMFTGNTDQKQAEEALRESEAQFRTLANAIPQLCWMANPDGWISWYNQRWYEYTGTTPEQMEGWGWQSVHDPEVLPKVLECWKASIATGEPFDMVFPLRGADGAFRPFLTRVMPVRDRDGKVARWFGTNTDIGEQRKIEEALRQSRDRELARATELQAIMDAMPAAAFISRDPECREMIGNRMTYELLRLPPGSNVSTTAPGGRKPAAFRLMKDGIEIPSEELPVQRAAFTGQPVRNCEMDLVFEDGASANLLGDAVPLLDENGRPRGAVGVFVDIAERKRAEVRLRDAQKLESLGLLAGGVAHDFNNLLVGVIGNASLAQELLPPDNPAAELLDAVIKTGEQAAHLTRQMLAYSGKGKFQVEALHLSALIHEMCGLVRLSISKKIALTLDLGEDLPPIEADRGQLQQVFMNLAINAAEAIGSRDGLISVRTGVQNVDDRYLRHCPEAAELWPGQYVFLEVRDTGCGMDDDTRARIFDPFFSTKFTGRGLGLAAVAGIVRGHKGAIAVGSAPGKGSCFTVLFPAAERAAREPPVAPRNIALQGAGVVLLVDDERVVREMAKKTLELHGYTVLLADSGLAAVDLFRRHPGEIALVVLDLSMPAMSGEEALPELRKIRPEVKVVVSSGYSEAEAMTLFKGQRVSGFIQKPYTSTALVEKVKACAG